MSEQTQDTQAPVATQVGIKETKEMLVFFFALAKVYKEAKQNDGKVTYLDAVLLMKVLPSLGPAIDKADQIAEEIKDLDEAELSELAAYLGTEIGQVLDKAKVVNQVLKGLDAAKALYAFYKSFEA